MKNKLDKYKGFILNTTCFPYWTTDLMIIPNYYIELMIISNKNKNLYSEGKKILNIILLNKDNIIYINDEDLFKKIKQLMATNNKELVKSMFNTIKEFENKNERNKRIEKFNQFIK
jgi:hypothetical protein